MHYQINHEMSRRIYTLIQELVVFSLAFPRQLILRDSSRDGIQPASDAGSKQGLRLILRATSSYLYINVYCTFLCNLVICVGALVMQQTMGAQVCREVGTICRDQGQLRTTSH